VALADGLRLEAAEAVRLLKQAGTKRLVMLTTAHRRTADSRAGRNFRIPGGTPSRQASGGASPFWRRRLAMGSTIALAAADINFAVGN